MQGKTTHGRLGDLLDAEVLYTAQLNKCTFGVSFTKFLDLMVSHHGIKANPKKLQAILGMTPPRSRKEVQHLARVAALRRFVARSDDKCPAFFKALR